MDALAEEDTDILQRVIGGCLIAVNRPTPHEIAIHEASHAMVAAALGHRVTVIRVNKSRSRRVEGRTAYKFWTQLHPVFALELKEQGQLEELARREEAAQLEDAAHHAMIDIAGLCGEAYFLARVDAYGSNDDRASFRKHVCYIASATGRAFFDVGIEIVEHTAAVLKNNEALVRAVAAEAENGPIFSQRCWQLLRQPTQPAKKPDLPIIPSEPEGDRASQTRLTRLPSTKLITPGTPSLPSDEALREEALKSQLYKLGAANRYSNAALPAAYEEAKAALVACLETDECEYWPDKQAALDSYQRQAYGDTLVQIAKAIQSNAFDKVIRLSKEVAEKKSAKRIKGQHRKNGSRKTKANHIGHLAAVASSFCEGHAAIATVSLDSSEIIH